MKVCLATRYFDTSRKEGVGIGRVSIGLRDGLKARGIEVVPISDGSGLYNYFAYASLFIKLKLPQNCDVYHALTPIESLWLPKDKSVVTFHDLFQLTNPDKIGGGLEKRSWEKFIGINYFKMACHIATRCKKIVCVSNKTKDAVVEYLGVPEEKIKVIYSGISANLEPKKKLGGKFTVGYLGMLDRRKRVDLLIKAFKQTKIDGYLYIGGRGLEEDYLDELAGGDMRIRFFGHIADEQLPEFLNSLDLFVFPTAQEGFGLPICEAFACNKPVVVFSDALIPHEIKSRCLKVQNIDELVGLIGQFCYAGWVVSSVDLESNYKFAKGYDWENTVSEYIKVYEEVMND